MEHGISSRAHMALLGLFYGGSGHPHYLIFLSPELSPALSAALLGSAGREMYAHPAATSRNFVFERVSSTPEL